MENKDTSFLMNFFRNILIVVFIASVYLISVYSYDSYTYKKNSQVLNEQYQSDLVEKNSDNIYKNLEDFIRINQDTVGYLVIPDTDATGPVVQTDNNQYYLSHDFYKKINRFGARFLDYRNEMSQNGLEDQNSIIYGHYTDEKILFAELNKYKDIEFYKKNPIIEFNTLYKKTKWKVFAAFITNTNPSDGEIFEYNVIDFENQKKFLHFIEEIKHRSIIVTTVDVIENDKILMLSTCSRTFKDARFVLVARQIRENESESVNVRDAKENENPLYPDIWYKKVDKDAVKPTFD